MTEVINLSNDPDFAPGQDLDAVQSIVLAAAIDGNGQIRSKLPKLLSAFEEPFRTVATKVNSAILAGQFVDKNTISLLLEGCHFSRRTAAGVISRSRSSRSSI